MQKNEEKVLNFNCFLRRIQLKLKFFTIFPIIFLYIILKYSQVNNTTNDFLLILICIPLIMIFLGFTISKNMKGKFILNSREFTLKLYFYKRVISPNSIEKIIREYYKEDNEDAVYRHIILNPNQYRIVIKNQKDIVLNITKKEEKEYYKKCLKLGKEIYSNNNLTDNQKDIEYEIRKPKEDFKLKLAIDELSQFYNIKIEDETEENSTKFLNINNYIR